MVLEGDNPATVLLKYVAQAGINSLVLGSSSPSYFGRYGIGSRWLGYAFVRDV